MVFFLHEKTLVYYLKKRSERVEKIVLKGGKRYQELIEVPDSVIHLFNKKIGDEENETMGKNGKSCLVII